MGIARPVFETGLLLSKNARDANFVVLATEVAWIRGLSYGEDGTAAGGMYVIVLVVTPDPELGGLAVPNVPQEFAPIFVHA